MKKYILGAILSLGLLVSPIFVSPVQAAGLTSQQINSILTLLQSFGADQSVINRVSITLNHGSTNSVTIDTANSTSLSGVFVIQDDGTLINSNNVVDEKAVARKFYALNPNQKDNYDFLSIFTTFHDSSIVEHHDTIHSGVTGIGGVILSSSADFPNKLLGINFLNDTYSAVSGNVTPENVNNNLWLMDHETGHQWLTYVGVSQNISDGMHYTKWVDTGFMKNGQQWGDAMGGWPWKDNGNGTVSVGNIQKQAFSKLSLYLMGFAPASEVSSIRTVIPTNPQDAGYQNVKGTFNTFTINDIIAQYGTRSPSYQNAQKDFKMAYILLTKNGETSTQYKADLNNVSAVARDFPSEWNLVTDGRSTISQSPNTYSVPTPTTSTVSVAVPTITLTASPSAPGFGQNVTLSWSSTNTSSCTVSSSPLDSSWTGGVSTSGTKLVGPINQITIYSLTCTSASGGSANQSLTLSPRG